MCRWITLLSSSRPVKLSDLVYEADNSLVKMSYNAGYHPGFGPTNNSLFNGDGFGVGWYFYDNSDNGDKHDKDAAYARPAVFRDVLPAWSDQNLREVCEACTSRCVVAHVRAASPGSVVSRENCHPFKCGRLIFCHNGRIDGFWGMRKHLLGELTQAAYFQVRGTTDSEAAFGMILDELERDGLSDEPPATQTRPYEPARLVNAVENTIRKLERYQKTLDYDRSLCRGFSTLNFSLTDGDTVVVSRYCDQDPTIPAPSLYFAFDRADTLRDGLMRKQSCRDHHGPGDGSDSSAQATSHPGLTTHKKDDAVTPPDAASRPLTKGDFAQLVEKGMKRVTSFQEFGDVREKLEKLTEAGKLPLDEMAFCVSSDPLTFCDMWNPVPSNSIVYYSTGGLPETVLLSKEGETREDRYAFEDWKAQQLKHQQSFASEPLYEEKKLEASA